MKNDIIYKTTSMASEYSSSFCTVPDKISTCLTEVKVSEMFTVLPGEENIEVIINDDVTVVRNRKNKKKVVLRRCDLDEEDREKAILYGLLKLIGYKKAELDRIINNARDCRVKNDEESN